ncbi:MAG: hypothetical protein OXG27_15700 [Chloroflexi bacterium]|nr:hypothetical protein [Chloroflexota bacterium]
MAASDRAGRLCGLLQDLLRTHGRRRTAELLGLSERTLQRLQRVERVERAAAGEQLSEQFLRALEDYEAKQAGPGAQSPLTPLATETAAELANLRRRMEKLEHAVPEDIGDVPGAVERLASTVEQLQQQVRALQQGGEVECSVASVGSVGVATKATGIKTVDSPLRPYPELVTTESEPGERRFYGEAMAAVAAWRRTRARRERASNALNRLDRLRADERLLELELELVGEHGLTLPPAERPWDGLRRQTELRVTREALRRVRRDRLRAQVVHWLLRLLTLGLWGRRRG